MRSINYEGLGKLFSNEEAVEIELLMTAVEQIVLGSYYCTSI